MAIGVYKRTKPAWNKGKVGCFSQETREAIGNSQRGEKSHNWKDGISKDKKAYWKNYYRTHREKLISVATEWNKVNIERHRATKNRYWRDKYQGVITFRRRAEPKLRVDHHIGTALWCALKGRKSGRNWESFVGYTLADLMAWLEQRFDRNMNWENYGSFWVVDHIIPKSLFCYSGYLDREFRQCWCLANLQPLEKITNLKKGGRCEKSG